MNKSQLQNDLNCDALISTAKQRRRRQIATLATVPAILIGLSLWLWSPSGTPSEIANTSPNPLALPPQQTSPTPETPPVSQLEIIQSDDELLALLANYGPVLVENKNGKQSLFLTSPQNKPQIISN